MEICYLGIGSNLGNRRKNIRLSIRKVNHLEKTKVIKASKIIETAPVGGPAYQVKFLNAAVKIETDIQPFALLEKLKKIEREMGRVKGVRNGPRVVDLDILFYADKIIKRHGLRVPHPRMFERDFVLRPLSEII